MELVTSLMGGGNTAYIAGGAVLALAVFFFFLRSKLRKWKKNRLIARQLRIERQNSDKSLENHIKQSDRELTDAKRKAEIEKNEDNDRVDADLIR